jgi:regulator of sigma E protease
MTTIFNIALSLFIFVLLLGLIVFIHELGHFLAAKKAKILVQEFAFGFGPKLFGKKYKGTMYRINLFPLGGYVKMLGDQDGSSFLRYNLKKNKKEDNEFVLSLLKKNKIDINTQDFFIIEEFINKQAEILPQDEYEKLQNYIYYEFIPNHPGNMDNKSFKDKTLLIVAGVLMNFILGIILFYIFFSSVGFYTDLRKLGNPLMVGADVSNPPFLVEMFSTDNSLVSDSLLINADGELINSQTKFDQLLDEKYNLPIKLHVQRLYMGSAEYKDIELVLNGDGIKSSLDKDLRGVIKISEVAKDSLAEKIGLKEDYYLSKISGQKVDDNIIISDILIANSGNYLKINYIDLMGNEKETSFLVPAINTDNTITLGISYSFNNPYLDSVIRVDYSNQKILSGISHSFNMSVYNFTGLFELFKQSIKEKSIEPVSSGVSSVVGVSGLIYSLVKGNDFLNIINLGALVSLSLGVMNLLPIPLFDGGQLLFLIIEKSRKKRMSEKTQERISIIAFYSLIILSIIIVLKDIFQFDFINRIFGLLTSIF